MLQFSLFQLQLDSPVKPDPGLEFAVAITAEDKAAVMELRDLVYVRDQGRLDDVSDMAATFDRFDRQAVYILASRAGKPVGTIKIVPDSEAGLPCEFVADVTLERAPDRCLVEFGHLMTAPHVRNQEIGVGLMRAALRHSILELGATHVLGDFFVDESGRLRSFYTSLGFVPLGEPYADDRFAGAPFSLVAIVDVAEAERRSRLDTGQSGELLRYFFGGVTGGATGGVTARPAAPGRTRRQELAEAKARHNHTAYARLEFLMGCGVQGAGSGSHVLDHEGNDYLLLFDQYGNQAFGLSNDRVVAALREQIDRGPLNSVKTMFEEEFILLTQRLSELTAGALPYASISNSGAETIETALKLARASTGRQRFVTARNAFHGKTFAAISASGRPEHEALLGPLSPDFTQVPFDDLAALDAAVDEQTAAVLLEPVQAEGGVIVPSDNYLAEVRRICTERGALLILDEMQTGFGHTGTFFAFQRFGVQPDLVCLGKAFGGGVVPISAVLGTAAVWWPYNQVPSAFGSSLGGNPLCCRVGLETIAIASDESFLQGVKERETVLHDRLGALPEQYPHLIRQHRGLGTMHGLEFHDESLAGLTMALLYERRVITAYALYDSAVVRVQPPLTVSPADLDLGLTQLSEVLTEIEAYRVSRSDSDGPAVPEVSITVEVDRAPPDVLHALHRHPRLLDPFALDPEEPDETGETGEDFRGVLAGEPVRWPDQAHLRDDGVLLAARESWLWQRLDRRVTVASLAGNDRRSLVTVTVGWDAGLGDLEQVYAARLSSLVQERLGTLVTDFPSRFPD